MQAKNQLAFFIFYIIQNNKIFKYATYKLIFFNDIVFVELNKHLFYHGF